MRSISTSQAKSLWWISSTTSSRAGVVCADIGSPLSFALRLTVAEQTGLLRALVLRLFGWFIPPSHDSANAGPGSIQFDPAGRQA